MSSLVRVPSLLLLLSGLSVAEQIQGVLADWQCTERMVKQGRANVLQHDRSCSLMRNSARQAYGLITDEKKYYRLDDTGNQRARELLNNSHDKDNLRVMTEGQLEGNTIKVQVMTIL